jgi:GTP-binding protein HflX
MTATRASATNNRITEHETAPQREVALLVHVRAPGEDPQEPLEELRLLALSAGAVVRDVVVATRGRPDPATYIGKGKVEELRLQIAAEQIALVIVNHELSPAQERNLEKAIGCRVLDRTGLILDIFAQRARTHEGKLQVELAQLERLATRLVRGWTHLERQRGGIGLRGPGETQLETDRRLIGVRIKNLHRRLEKVRMQRGQRRKARRKIPIPTVSLVGYTNAGKSSLFNRLTGADVYAADRLFATLDPTMRRLPLPGRTDIILADTVGFIRHLPHGLVEAFRATLEEVAEADLLLHVVDSSDPERQTYMEQVQEVLTEIGAETIPQIVVFNKIDVTDEPPQLVHDEAGLASKVWLSAHTGEGLDLLRQALGEYFAQSRSYRRLCLPPEAGALRARIYQRLDVVEEQATDAGGWLLEVAVDPSDLAWLAHQQDFHAHWLQTDSAPVLAHA